MLCAHWQSIHLRSDFVSNPYAVVHSSPPSETSNWIQRLGRYCASTYPATLEKIGPSKRNLTVDSCTIVGYRSPFIYVYFRCSDPFLPPFLALVRTWNPQVVSGTSRGGFAVIRVVFHTSSCQILSGKFQDRCYVYQTGFYKQVLVDQNVLLIPKY
jgi:hypothetical protein